MSVFMSESSRQLVRRAQRASLTLKPGMWMRTGQAVAFIYDERQPELPLGHVVASNAVDKGKLSRTAEILLHKTTRMLKEVALTELYYREQGPCLQIAYSDIIVSLEHKPAGAYMSA